MIELPGKCDEPETPKGKLANFACTLAERVRQGRQNSDVPLPSEWTLGGYSGARTIDCKDPTTVTFRRRIFLEF